MGDESHRRRETFFVSKNMIDTNLIIENMLSGIFAVVKIFLFSKTVLVLFLIFFIVFFVKAYITKRGFRKKEGCYSTETREDNPEASHEKDKKPYRKKSYLLFEAEKDFYFVLSGILKDDYLLFSKVGMGDLFYLPSHQFKWRSYRNKIQSKHVDFLICDKINIRPLLAVELDDSSHLREDGRERDDFVDGVFKDANLPILHIKNSHKYDSLALEKQISSDLEVLADFKISE